MLFIFTIFQKASPCPTEAPVGDDVVVPEPSGEGSYANGTEVVYSCPNGYDFNGDMTSVCLYGNWTSDQAPYCTGK